MSINKTTIIAIIVFLFFGLANNTFAATSVTKDSITWTFDGDYPVGQFVTGDWYVVAPGGLQVTGISPGWDGTQNGSMVNPDPTIGAQGYHSSAPGYNSSLNVAISLPISLSVGDMLISTTGRTPGSNKSYIDEAAILTVLQNSPATGSLRPGYCDTNRVIYNVSSFDYSLLKKLPPVPSTPSMSSVEDMFARPWIDHLGGWTGRMIHPANNMPDYGRDLTRNVSTGALMLQLDYSNTAKEQLLANYVQLGIDLYSIVKSGSLDHWYADGGHAPGRKWPILFAGLMLNDSNMKNIGQKSGDYALSGSYANPPSDYIHFGEDDQTFYVTQDDVNCTHNIGCTWNPDTRGGTPQPYTNSMIGMPEWGIRHVYSPDRDNALWTATYRQCCNALTWGGFVLATYFMNAKSLWNHPALFDYMDRYVAISNGDSDPFGYTVPGETAGWGLDAFMSEMWDTYRDNYPNNYSADFRADVDNNSQINTTDAMLTLRDSVGLDMSGTNWQSSSTTGDADCDGDTDSTDAMLILRDSLGLGMSGTGWCVN